MIFIKCEGNFVCFYHVMYGHYCKNTKKLQIAVILYDGGSLKIHIFADIQYINKSFAALISTNNSFHNQHIIKIQYLNYNDNQQFLIW